MSSTGTGRGTRLGISLQVVLSAGLALVALGFVNYLAGRQGIRQRFDLTEKRVNTLSTAARGVVSRLEEPVTIDVFYRPIAGPLRPLQDKVMEQVQRLLGLMDEASEFVELRFNNVADRVALDQRRRDLRLMGFDNCVVVTTETQREVLRLSGDLAEFDIGNLDPNAYRPARIRVFHAEERIVQALLEVQAQRAPKIYATSGHGERDAFDVDDPNALGKLFEALGEDGFEVEWWSHDVDGALPEDCTVLTILGPTSPFTPEEREAVKSFVDGGGRLVVAPPNDLRDLEASGLIDWMEEWGIEVSRGVVCTPVYMEGRAVVGELQNVVHQLGPAQMSEHPINAPLREGGRFLRISFPRRVKVVRQPEQGASVPLMSSTPQSWMDLPSTAGEFDFRPQEEYEELGPHPLMVVSRFQTDETQGPVNALEEEKEARLLVLGSADVFCNYLLDFNRDFARNLFNWVADREYRVAISPRDPDQRRLPIARTDALTRVGWVTLWGLPGFCAVAGVLLAVLRARSGRRPA